MKKAIFLDRDDTIIKNISYLNDPNGVEFLPGAFEGLKKFYEQDYLLIIATNQSGVPRGLVELDNLHAIHRKIEQECLGHGIEFTDIYYAPYLPESNHPMRKPNPGMLLQAARDHKIDLNKSWMIGDRHSDIAAGFQAGTQNILVRAQKLTPEELEKGIEALKNCLPKVPLEEIRPKAIVYSLMEAFDVVMENKKPRTCCTSVKPKI